MVKNVDKRHDIILVVLVSVLKGSSLWISVSLGSGSFLNGSLYSQSWPGLDELRPGISLAYVKPRGFSSNTTPPGDEKPPSGDNNGSKSNVSSMPCFCTGFCHQRKGGLGWKTQEKVAEGLLMPPKIIINYNVGVRED